MKLGHTSQRQQVCLITLISNSTEPSSHPNDIHRRPHQYAISLKLNTPYTPVGDSTTLPGRLKNTQPCPRSNIGRRQGYYGGDLVCVKARNCPSLSAQWRTYGTQEQRACCHLAAVINKTQCSPLGRVIRDDQYLVVDTTPQDGFPGLGSLIWGAPMSHVNFKNRQCPMSLNFPCSMSHPT